LIFVFIRVKMPANFTFARGCLCCLIVFNLMAATINAQQVNPDKSYNELIEITETFYGTDDVLVNGQKYIPGHFMADGHPYFPDETWTKGSVTMDGKLFEGVDLLYNAEIDQLILRTILSRGDTVFVACNTAKVETFSIGGHTFTSLISPEADQQFKGFYEQIYHGNFSFLIKHQKSFIADYSKTSPKGHFSKLNSTNFIFQNGQLTKVTNQKSFLNYFSQNSKAIKAFMKKNKIRYATANHSTMKLLLKYCDDLSSGKI